ncbi:chemotaxis protein CheW [Candidatus Parabeggiatoa sp. HSG14]|uniref:chemotaxis protein CheW n=1 Tax=Candidatus Parabeggiatoa sp. HSG14 TaxID=3055593 RepID=UPI0025A763CC|nr:chemotaxis protein CheW [Thiotrichales bacterium HSG14]
MLSPSQALNRPLNRQALAPSISEGEKVTRRIGFLMGNVGLLIAQLAISELSEPLEICPIPFTANWLLGLINLRGNLVPVFDLHQLLQMERSVEKGQLLILGQGQNAGAIVIEELPKHLTFTEADKLNSPPPMPSIIKPFTASGYEKNGQIWFNFDHLGFFEHLATKVGG